MTPFVSTIIPPRANSPEMYIAVSVLCRYGDDDDQLLAQKMQTNGIRDENPHQRMKDSRMYKKQEKKKTHLKGQKSGETGNSTNGTEADHVTVGGTSVLGSSGDGAGHRGGHARGAGAGDPGNGDGASAERQLGALGADDGGADGVVDDGAQGGGGGGLDDGAAAGEDGDGGGGGRGGRGSSRRGRDGDSAGKDTELSGVLVGLGGPVDEHDSVSAGGSGGGSEVGGCPGEFTAVGDGVGNGQDGLAVGGGALAEDQSDRAGGGRVPGDGVGLAQGHGAAGVGGVERITAGTGAAGSWVEGSRVGVGRDRGDEASSNSEELHF